MQIALLLALLSTPACGPTLEAVFIEGAPRDRFDLISHAEAPWQVSRVEIVLEGSAGALIFDTAEGGPGRLVSQPFQTGAGEAVLAEVPTLADGARRLVLRFETFEGGQRFGFTTDLDDTSPSGAIGTTIAGAEIAGASVVATFTGPDGARVRQRASFDASATARVAMPCTS